MNKCLLIFLFSGLLSCNDDYQEKSVNLTERLKSQSMSSTDEKKLEIERMFQQYSKEFPNAENIEVKNIGSLVNPIYIDVREPFEYEVSVIPGAITKKEFERNKKSYLGKQLVVYCTIGYRSGIYTQDLISEGFKALNLKGGVLSWSHEDRLFESSDLAVKLIHVYGKQWDLANSSYETIY